MAYVDVDKFADLICNFPAIDEDSANAVISLLRRQPSADVAEVVRCTKCIYAEKHYDTTHLIGNTYFPSGVPTKLLYITCEYHQGKLAENDFCSYGRSTPQKEIV